MNFSFHPEYSTAKIGNFVRAALQANVNISFELGHSLLAKMKPHEMLLWADPNVNNRALLFMTTPAIDTDPTIPNLMVFEISQVPNGGAVTEVAEGVGTTAILAPIRPTIPLIPLLQTAVDRTTVTSLCIQSE